MNLKPKFRLSVSEPRTSSPKPRATNHAPRTTSHESGVSTILAIGITSMLLVLGVAFLTTSMIEKKASDNYQSIMTARTAAKNALDRALTIMRDAPMNIALNTLVSHQSDGTITDTEMAELSLVLNNTYIDDLPIADSVYKLTSWPVTTAAISTATTLPTWIYVKSNEVDSPTERKYLGRFAFVLKADTGKLDISAVEDSGENAADYSRAIPIELTAYNVSQNTMVDSSGNYVVGRPGRDPSEIFLNSVMNTVGGTTSWFGEDTIRVMGVKAATNPNQFSKLPPGKRWGSFDNIFNALETVAGYQVKTSAKDNFKQVFSVYEPAMPETFWIDVDNDGFMFKNELYDRFNLARDDWDDMSVGDLLPESPTPVSTSDCIPWLLYWSDAGGTLSAAVANHQIAANLIDYCDSDDTPQLDDADDPTYLGLEAVPYINRVTFSIPGSIAVSNNGKNGNALRYTYTFTTSAIADTVQLVDMYKKTKNIKVQMESEIVLQWGDANGGLTPESSISLSDTSAAFNSLAAPSNNGYTLKAMSGSNSLLQTGGAKTLITTDKNPITNTKIQAQIKNLKVKVLASDNVTLYDYSWILDNDSIWHDVVTNITGTSNVSGTLLISYQVADPRQNHRPPDWSYTYSALGNISNNSTFAPNTGDVDPEPTAAYPYQISTAYIRNAPMKSPWELGFIHRAKAFQTINLKKYNITAGNQPDAGGGAYSLGDANILDQVKMSEDIERYGAMNVNSQCDTALRALFEYINIGSDPANPGELKTTSITNNNINDTAKAISDTIRQNNLPILYTRASLLGKASVTTQLTSLAGQINDRTQEEVIGKFINLTEASPGNVYYIIAVGQAIRDVKDAPTGSGTAAYQEYIQGVDEVLSTQKILATVVRDPQSNNFKIIKLEYLSD